MKRFQVTINTLTFRVVDVPDDEDAKDIYMQIQSQLRKADPSAMTKITFNHKLDKDVWVRWNDVAVMSVSEI